MSDTAYFIQGLLPLHRIVSQGKYELRVDLEDFDGEVRYAKYEGFSIGSSATNYVLEAVDYSGDAGINRIKKRLYNNITRRYNFFFSHLKYKYTQEITQLNSSC